MQTPVFVVLLIVVVAPVTLAYTAGESGIASQVAVLGVAVVLLVRGSTWRRGSSAKSGCWSRSSSRMRPTVISVSISLMRNEPR